MNGSTVTIPFTGVRLDWIATKGTTLGIANVSVDGGATTQVNLNNAVVQYQQRVFSTGTLPSGPHTLTISWANVASNTTPTTDLYVSIDAVEIFGGGLVANTRTQQTAIPPLDYTGPWAMFTTANASGGSYTRLNANGQISIDFTGVRLGWISTVGSTLGLAQVSVDNGAWQDVNLNDPNNTWYQQDVWSVVVPYGVHNVKIRWANVASNTTPNPDRYISVDAIDVAGTLQ